MMTIMYIPSKFKNDDLSEIHHFCEQYGFATVISETGSGLQINHLPLILDKKKGVKGTLLGHMAKANPQWKNWDKPSQVTCLFQGPNHYISPSWYRDPLNVPTWNYAVVHICGSPRLILDPEEIEGILNKTVEHFEAREGSEWKYNLPEDYRSNLTQAIVGFEIEISRIEAKFKLSQNRNDEDRASAIQALESKSDLASKEMAKLMKTHWPEKKWS